MIADVDYWKTQWI